MNLLSKSQYVRGVQCVKSLWLYRHRKDLKSDMDPFQQSMADQGTQFGILAHQRFAGGVKITQGPQDPKGALEATAVALASGATVLYEGAFLYQDVLVRPDILINRGAGWQLYEVKSGTKVEEVHMNDVAIQLYVLRGAGLPVVQTSIMHANPGYVRRGALDLVQLFQVEDVTASVQTMMPEVPGMLAILKAQVDQAEAPPTPIGAHCTTPYPCDFKAHCWAHVPEYSVFNLGYAKMKEKLAMFNSGVQRIEQINPSMHKLTAGQIRQIEVAKESVPRIDIKSIKKFLGTLVYPVTHLDFETDNPVIPPYDGLRPYSQMPFQASVRVQQQPGATLTEYGFLGDGLKDPRSALVEFLVDKVERKGSVIAYHKSFESGRLEELAKDHAVTDSKFQGALLGIIPRLWDLADPFRTGAYVHPHFRGRWSIKAVLPALVPSMTYEGMEIGDGAAAMAAYAQLRDPKLPAAERARLMNALKVYCGQDTMAMVKILDHLYEVAFAKVGV